jgi:hypothetical protein
VLDRNKVEKLVLFSEEAWFTLGRNIHSQNSRYCGVMKIAMQFIESL